ncbi:GNAT family protein [Halobacillus karajensis]|uniref:N-acetyltransferase domain-containing protein n=1 Tax=Halobacillus karajensis TaxID=195088 RepID=A0A024P6V2_9BACI|nr:hypothetical protein [Halobacillus karajensis]CDQ21167.1 hypothetical protein BN982_03532 [Halobacillus karajensis]CDQ24769.1 hypothetical protein BN983_03066 [Halobacillus karajensis]CDQ28871.1 hypothetical protein BN981_03188 [Halobacillus karajensis]
MIKAANSGDTDTYRKLIETLEAESDFLLYGKGERLWTREQVARLLKKMEKDRNSIIFLSEINGKPNGHVTVLGGGAPRNIHSAKIITGVRKDFQGKGIAKRLFSHLFI